MKTIKEPQEGLPEEQIKEVKSRADTSLKRASEIYQVLAKEALKPYPKGLTINDVREVMGIFTFLVDMLVVKISTAAQAIPDEDNRKRAFVAAEYSLNALGESVSEAKKVNNRSMFG